MPGPVAMLIYSTAQNAAALDENFNIRRNGHLHIDLINTPIQQLQFELSRCAEQAPMWHASRIRTALSGIQGIDRDAIRQALAKRDLKESRILKHCMSVSSWANEHLFQAGQAGSLACQFCGHPKQTRHLIHERPALDKTREEARVSLLGAAQLGDLLMPLQLGLPPIMACAYDNAFWGTDWRELAKPSPELGCFNCDKPFSNKQLKDILDNVCFNHPGITAESAVSRIRGTFGEGDFPPATWTNSLPPAQPNV